MTVVMINPNSTVSMTEAMLAAAQDAAPEFSFAGWTSHEGPPAIQGAEDGDVATPPLLALVHKASEQGAQGIIIGCFDDTALTEAARIAKCPVVGIGQASYHKAALRNWRFSVVTTLPVSVPVIEDNIRQFGLGGFAARVRASNVPVLALETDGEAAELTIVEEAKRAASEDGIDAVILGCAGMVNVTRAVKASIGPAVIDPVVAAATSMKWLA